MWTRPRRAIEVVGLLVVVVVLALAGQAAGARAEAGEGSWAATGSLPEPWLGGSAVTLASGQVLAVGGANWLNESEHEFSVIYDPGSGTWLQGPELPGTGHNWTVVALAGGGALLLGETVCGRPAAGICSPTTSAYLLGPKEAEWLPTGSLNEARVEPAAVRLADGRVLVAGGLGNDCEATPLGGFSCAAISSAEVYDPATGEFTSTTPLPKTYSGGAGALLSDDTVLLPAGGEEDVAGHDSAVRYDPASGNWMAAGQTAFMRNSPLLFGLPGDRAFTLSRGKPWAGFGSLGAGVDRRQLTCLPITSEIFTATSDAWMASLPTPTGSENCAATVGALLAGGEIMVGVENARPDLEEMYLLDSEQRCWSATGPVVEPRDDGDVVALADGRALVFGGYEANSHEGQLSSAEIYTPGPDACPPSDPPVTDLGPGSGPTTTQPRFAGASIEHKRLTIAKGNIIHLLVQCPTSAVGRCVGRVRVSLLAATSAGGRARVHAKSMFLGDASFAAIAGRTTTVTIRLIRHGRTLDTLIHRWRHATVILTAIAQDGTGQLVTTTASQTLR
jgi:hypothetical protein